MTSVVLAAYGLNGDHTTVEAFGSGLINRTWKMTTPDKVFILQQVNQQVFREPADIAYNHRLLADYLKQHHPEYVFVAPIRSFTGKELVYENGGCFRLLPFVHGSHTIDVVATPQQAYEAARQFGCFTRMLSGMDAAELKTTIPSFHDLELRYSQFLLALKYGNHRRTRQAAAVIETAQSYVSIVDAYKAIQQSAAFQRRVTHHDTKISNVLFDEENKGICVIDLDTVMPGYFISDVGDMMRTYLSPVSEEERDFSKIEVRDDFFAAVVEGYYAEMKGVLTAAEKESFFYAGTFLVYMQALRFLTDHLNNDVYYGAAYEGHNLVRAQNQFTLLHRLVQKQEPLQKLVARITTPVSIQYPDQ